MITFDKTSGILISKQFENEPFYGQIKSSLYRVCRSYHSEDSLHYQFYIEGERFLKIPRFFPVEVFTDCQVEDKLLDGESINIEDHIELRDDVQRSMVNFMLSNNRGLVQAPPGSGKTVVCIKMVAERKKKTFILVHRDTLADQWKGPGNEEGKQGFLDFTNLKDEDISRLTSASFKEDLKRPIIISTVQTFLSLLKRNKVEFLTFINNANIGILIGDEVHTSVGAPQFSECSIHIPAKIVFGLSATPYRLDGNEDIIRYHVGEVFVPEGERKVVGAKVTVLLFEFGIPAKSRGYLYWGGEFQRSRYLNMLKKAEPFMSICKSLLKKFSNDNKRVIFVAERVKLLEEQYKNLDTLDKSRFFGSAKKDQLNFQVTFSTPGKIRDGVDAPSKDVLIMTSPISNIEQMCGRLEREYKGKERLVVVDMVDLAFSRIRTTLFTRMKYYEKKSWEISFIQILKDGTKKEITKKETIELIKEK
jgi:superfamily II DNA or RNA helicase